MRSAWGLALAMGCTSSEGVLTPPETLSITPSTAPVHGMVEVTIDLEAAGIEPATVRAVHVAGVRALYPRVEAGLLHVTVQGAADDGPSDVVIDVDGEPRTFPFAFTYTPPLNPAFERVISVGASLSMGMQSGGLTDGIVRASPPALVARQLGAWLPQPLLMPDLLPPIPLSKVGAAPECTFPSYAAHFASVLPTAMFRLLDGDRLNYALGRLDAEIEVRNVAVGGTKTGELIRPPAPDEDIAETVIGHLLYEPTGALSDPLTRSQIDVAEDLNPTLVLAMDIVANDLIDPIIDTPDVDLSLATPLDVFAADLDAVLARLSATGAIVVLGNQPRCSLMPLLGDRRQTWIATGGDPAWFDTRAADLDALCIAYNDTIAEVAAAYPQVIVVDVFGMGEELIASGIQADGHHLSADRFGGLISIDGLHFTPTANGLLANRFLEAIGERLQIDVPLIDLNAVAATDPWLPEALRAGGVDPLCLPAE